MELKKIFNEGLTANGDNTFKSTLNDLLDLFFMTAYFEKNLAKVSIGDSEREKLFSMFVRDPRYGLGRRALGRKLMELSKVDAKNVIKAGRFDDLLSVVSFEEASKILYDEVKAGNELAKKWCPRFGSKDKALASKLAKSWKVNKQTYGKMVKASTVEHTMSDKKFDDIDFAKLPSLALLKYYKRFNTKDDTKERFNKYLNDVKSGKAEMHVTTTTVYDIYKNRKTIDADLFFDKLEKVSLSILPIVDVSGSMRSNDAIGKAISIGMYLSLCSTYENGSFVTFSNDPELVSFKGLKYNDAITKMRTSNWDNSTDFGAVCNLLKQLDDANAPEYICVLSDMEFNVGSSQSKAEMMRIFKENDIKTKLIWWNFNSHNNITPVTADEDGNIFMSGYSPMLLKFLQAGFNGEQFLNELLDQYKKEIEK